MATISDEAVHAKTGRTWPEWFDLLDKAGADRMSHKEIVAYLAENTNLGSWWQQGVTVAYEKARGMRAVHERPDGFEIGVSKTINVPVSRLYTAFAMDRERALWLEGDKLIITTARSEKSIRGTWAEGPTRINVSFFPRSPEKTQVTVNHSKIEDAETAERMKAFWRARLDELERQMRA